MSMDQRVFEECLEAWRMSSGNSTTPFWDTLAKKHGYPSTEALRSQFKRERKSRHIEKDGQRTVQQNPIVGVVDIETLPLEIRGRMWNIHNQYIPHSMIESNWALLSWSAKYLNQSGVISDVLSPKEAVARDSERILTSLWKFIDTCHIVIGHNFDGFDGGIIVSELTKYGLPPLKYRTIDTYKLIKRHYRLPSYSLAYVNRFFGLRDKMSNEGMPLWNRCAEGDPDALLEMDTYNQEDVLAGEDLFFKIQPYCDNSIPNFGTYSDELLQICHCGNSSFRREERDWFTNQARYAKYRCTKCGALHRGKRNLLTKDKTSSLLVRL